MGSLQRKEQPPAAIKKVCTNKVYNVITVYAKRKKYRPSWAVDLLKKKKKKIS